MLIAHIDLFDCQGGAAMIASHIIAASDEAGYESVRFVHRPIRPDKRTIPIPPLAGPYLKFLDPSARDWIPNIHASALLPVLVHPAFFAADIVHLHCINGDYFSYLLLPFLAAKPLVWTIHDTLSVTAKCLNAQYCLKWKTDDCRNCPLDGAEKKPELEDRRHLLQKIKNDIMYSCHFTAIAPSKWIADILKQSSFKNQDIRMIHNGVPTDIFYPRNKQEARRLLNLPGDKKIILFAAHGGLKSGMKGGQYLMEALQRAAASHKPWFLLEVGAVGEPLSYPVEGLAVSYVEDTNKLALYYAAADVFVSTSLSESFGLTVCEAQACGVPVVTFAVGGLMEIVEHEKTGYLVNKGDVNTLFHRLEVILDSPQIAEVFSLNAWQRVETLFSSRVMGEQYLRLYRELTNEKK